MTSLNEKPNRTEALKYYRRVAEHYKLDIHQYERVDNIAGADGAFQVSYHGRYGCQHSYAARKIVLATGYYDVPNLLNVPGEDLPKVLHYYKEAASLLQPGCCRDRREEFSRHRRARTVLDRRARDTDSPRRGNFRKSEVLDSARILKTESRMARSRRTFIPALWRSGRTRFC